MKQNMTCSQVQAMAADCPSISITVTETRLGVMVHADGPLNSSDVSAKIAKAMVDTARLMVVLGIEVVIVCDTDKAHPPWMNHTTKEAL